jgi:D-tyrosyl-tRNA(Tyr) deacylase
VNYASVTVEGKITGAIEKGFLVLAGWEDSDNDEDLTWMSGKIVRLRIFSDENGLMNLSIQETGGDILLISQFTLFASTKKGNRPSFIRSAITDFAIPMYNKFIAQLESELGKSIQTGIFGADMNVSLDNDGPVTIFIDSKNRE